MKKILLFTILAGFALFAAGQNIKVTRIKADSSYILKLTTSASDTGIVMSNGQLYKRLVTSISAALLQGLDTTGVYIGAAGQNGGCIVAKRDTVTGCATDWVRIEDSLSAKRVDNDTAYYIDGKRVLYQKYSLDNLFVGFGTSNSITGDYNTTAGCRSFQYNTSGYQNTAVGYFSMQRNVSGFSNSAIGVSALKEQTNGRYNVGVGNGSLQNNKSGWNNTAVGFGAGTGSRGSNNIYIGANAGTFITDSINGLLIINGMETHTTQKQDTTQSIIFGRQDADSSKQHLWLNANVHVGSLFGAYDCGTYADNTPYQALTDGFVTATATGLGDELYLYGYTDAANPPTTIIQRCGFNVTGTENLDCSIMFPVRKGDYWKVESSTSRCWLPLN